MAAKQNVHWIKNGRRPKQKKKGSRRRGQETPKPRPGRFYAGANEEQGQGQSTTVVCAQEKEKKKVPWGTILLTGGVSTAGAIMAYKAYEKFSGDKKEGGGGEAPKLNPSHQSILDAKNLLLMTAPGAGRLNPYVQPLNNPAMAQAMAAGAAAMPPQPQQPQMTDEEILSYMDQFVQQYDE